MEYIRARGSLGHLNGVITIKALALQLCRMVVGITRAISGIGQEENHYEKRSRRAEVQRLKRYIKLGIELHVVGLTKGLQPI